MAITLPASDPRAEIIDLEKNIAPDNSGLVIGQYPKLGIIKSDRNEVKTDQTT